MYQRKIKRMIDLLIAILLGFILLPLFAVISVWIKLDSKGPILFTQKRIGIHKKYFNIYKFRTMRTDAPKNCPTHQFSNPERYITKSGAFLRKTSLDELPQLWNIIKGDMSFVGPRPALWNQYDLIAARDTYGANDIVPGLTGWAQIRGRDELEIKEKASLDGEYIKNIGFWMDVRCFFGTIIPVLYHDGVVEGGTGKAYKRG